MKKKTMEFKGNFFEKAHFRKKITLKLTGYIVCPEIYHHDVKTAAILGPPSWISKFFQNVREPPKIAEKYSKSIKSAKKEVNVMELKLIFVNGNTKLQIWKKNGCRNDVAMVKSSSRHNNLSNQFIPDKF